MMACCLNCGYYDSSDKSCKAYQDYVEEPQKQWCEDYYRKENEQ